MFKQNAATIALSALILATAPALDLVSITAAVAAAAPSQTDITNQISQALADLKQTQAYKDATPAQKGAMLAGAVQAVVEGALNSGDSAATIAAALNDCVKNGVVTGAIAVQAAAQASAKVAQAGGVGASQAVGLTGDVQSEPDVQDSLSKFGSEIAVTSTNAQGQVVTTLEPLSFLLNGGPPPPPTTTTTTYTPCPGVVADYC